MTTTKNGTRTFSRKPADLPAIAFHLNSLQRALDRVRLACEAHGVDRVARDAIIRSMQIAITEACSGRVESDS